VTTQIIWLDIQGNPKKHFEVFLVGIALDREDQGASFKPLGGIIPKILTPE
jgi:hypothetical protein